MKNTKLFGLAVLAIFLAGSFMFTGCPEEPKEEKKTPEVVSVTILRDGTAVTAPISASKGSTITFTANVEVKNNAAKTVTWSVTGSSKSAINATTGVLTIAADEADNAALTVTATSTANTAKKATAAVNVLGASAPEVLSITVTAEDDAGFVRQGDTLQFSADVEVKNNAAKTVTWSLVGTYVTGTSISTTGLLSVALTESASLITVKAASSVVGFTSISGECTVTVLEEGAAEPTHWESVLYGLYPGAHALDLNGFTTPWGGVISDNTVTSDGTNYHQFEYAFPSSVTTTEYEGVMLVFTISDIKKPAGNTANKRISINFRKGKDGATNASQLYPANNADFPEGGVFIAAASGANFADMVTGGGFNLQNNAYDDANKTGWTLTFEAIMLLPVRDPADFGDKGDEYHLNPTGFVRNWGEINSAYDMVLFNNGAAVFAFPSGLTGTNYEKLIIDYHLVDAPETGTLNMIVKANNQNGGDLAYAEISRDAHHGPIEIDLTKLATGAAATVNVGFAVQTNTGSPNVPGYIVKFNSLTLIKKDGVEPPEPVFKNITITQSSGGTLATVPAATAEVGTDVLINVSGLTAGLKVGKLAVSGVTTITTVTANTQYKFTMPNADVAITVEYWPENVMYRVYSNGVLGTGYNLQGWEGGVPLNATPEGGGHSGTYAMSVTPQGEWGTGFGIIGSTPIDLNTVDALSLWIKASEAATLQEFGFGDDGNGPGQKDYHIVYQGENNNGIAVTTEWERIIIPVPNRKNATVYQVLHTWFANTQAGKILYIDDIEFITIAKDFDIVIPADKSASPNAVVPISGLVGTYKLAYGIDSKTSTLFTNNFSVDKWFAVDYNVTGAAINGANIEAPASGSFTFSITLDKDTANAKTSNTMTVEIELYSSEVIDDFAYAIVDSGSENGNTPVNEGLGFVFTGANWWAGLFPANPGGTGIDLKPGAQLGGTGQTSIARTNEKYDYINNITPFVTAKPIVAITMFTRGGEGDHPFTFQLHTGKHLAAESQHTEYTSTQFVTTNDRPAANASTDLDSGWVTIKIPLSDFVRTGGFGDGNDPITDLEDIIITGWKLSAVVGTVNYWIADIRLVEEE